MNLLLGRLYVQTRAFDKAIPPLRRVVDEQPGLARPPLLLATAQESAGQSTTRSRRSRTLLRENPGSFRGQLRIAEI